MAVVVALGTEFANQAPDVILELLTNIDSKRRYGRAVLRHEMFNRKEMDVNVVVKDTIMKPADTLYIDENRFNKRSMGIVTGFNITITTEDVNYDYTAEVVA